MNIRDAQPTDVPRMAQLITELGYPTTVEEMRARFDKISGDPDFKTIVAEENHQVVGMIGLQKCLAYELNNHFVRIIVLVIDPEYRGNGCGGKLLETGEAWAKEVKACTIALHSSMRRTQAHEFYKKHDYFIKGYGFYKYI